MLTFPVIIIALIVLYLLNAIKILREYERGVIFRLGRVLSKPKGPGLIFVFPPIDRMVRVSLRIVVMDIPAQESKDSILKELSFHQKIKEETQMKNKFISVSRDLVHEIGREPTYEEIAKKMDMPVYKVRKIMKISQAPLSFETPIGEEENSHIGDFIEDKVIPSPPDTVIQINLREKIEEALKNHTEREGRILKMRFGLGDGNEHTLEEVGQQFKVTWERIRQIEEKALRKLRQSSYSRKLKSFISDY